MNTNQIYPEKENNQYYQEYEVKDSNGNPQSPVMYNYSNANFNPQIAQQMGIEDWKNAQEGNDDDESESVSEDSKDVEKIKKKRKKYKHKVKSKIKPFACHLTTLIISDIIWVIMPIFGFMPEDAIVYMSDNFGTPQYNPTLFLVFFALQTVGKCFAINWFSSTDNLLANILKDDAACEQVDKIRQKRPKPRQGMECQHYEYRRDSKGNSKRKKIVTWVGYRQFNQAYWADWSREIQKALDKYKITAIVINKKLLFFDKKTEKHQNKMYSKFIQKNKDRDEHQSVFQNLHVDKFKQYTLACRKLKDKPWQFNSCLWYLCCLTFVAPLYHSFWSQVASIDYNLFKVISNKEKIKLDDNEGGEGSISSCTASDSECSCIGLGYEANNVVEEEDD